MMHTLLNYKLEMTSLALLGISRIEQLNPVIKEYSLIAGAILVTLTIIKVGFDILEKYRKWKDKRNGS